MQCRLVLCSLSKSYSRFHISVRKHSWDDHTVVVFLHKYIMLCCSKARLATNAHHHVFKENISLCKYSWAQKWEIEPYHLHVYSDPSNRSWDRKKTEIFNWQSSSRWRCLKVKAQRVISPTHPVCDSPNKHSCCWLIAFRQQSNLYTLTQYSKYTTKEKKHIHAHTERAFFYIPTLGHFKAQ